MCRRVFFNLLLCQLEREERKIVESKMLNNGLDKMLFQKRQ